MMGYHGHLNTWTPIAGEVFQCRMQPHTNAYKYTVAVMNKDKVVGHLMKGKNGKLAKRYSFS